MAQPTAASGGIQKELIEDIYPCTPLQEGLIALSIEQPGAYVSQTVIPLPRGVDVERFKKAWEAVVKSSAVLRTRIIYNEKRGSLAVVMKEGVEWQNSNNLEDYLRNDLKVHIRYGDRLTRYAIVVDSGNDEVCVIWSAHHAVYDGWSMDLITSRVYEVYNGGNLPKTAQFSDFIKYQMKTSPKDSDAFWSSYLTGASPAAFPRKPTDHYHLRTDARYDHTIRSLSEVTSDITMPTKLRAAWALTLAKYEDSELVVFGATLSGRNVPIQGIEDIIGPTIATVPIKVKVNRSMMLHDYLKQVQDEATEMMPYEHRGLQHIKRLSADTQTACGFRTLITVMPLKPEAVDPTSKGSEMLTPDGFYTYGLVLSMSFGGGSVVVSTEYDSNLLAKEELQTILFQFEHVLRQINEEPQKLLSEIEVFSPQDKAAVLAWNSNSLQRHERCVHKTIAEQVKTRQQEPAIAAWDGAFTYKELDILTTRLAKHLISLGVGPEVMVPLCFTKSAWAVVSMLSILKAGGACVSLDPSHPSTRLQTITRDIDASILLASVETVDKVSGLGVEVILVDEAFFTQLSDDEDDTEAPQTTVNPSNAAFVIYTSGSTGVPKGVVLEHASVCTSSQAHGSVLNIGPGSRVLQFSAYVFDISIQDIFTTLSRGGCVCILSDEERVNDLVGGINKLGATFACITPTVAGLLQPTDVPTLQTVVLAGEAVNAKVVEIWGDVESLNNCYGPAESTIYCAWNGNVATSASPSNIGRGLSSHLWVVNPQNHDRLAPVGCIGELLIEGPLLARGYLNDADKTSLSFISSPAWIAGYDNGASQRRMYKTGDLVRHNANGTLDYLGRKDTQVKIHGQRVELGEIEQQLLSEDCAETVIVLMPKSGRCANQLVAVMVLQELVAKHDQPQQEARAHILQVVEKTQMEIASLQTTRLRESLERKLPLYMMPSVWVIVSSIPLNTSGKLDRAMVSRWVQDIDEETHKYVSEIGTDKTTLPVTAMDRRVQSVISRVLNVPAEKISSGRSFQSLGGDSITAMQVVSRARADGLSLKVQDILNSKSISEIAMLTKVAGLSSKSRTDDVGVLFNLSPVQQMYIEMADGHPNQFNQSFLVRLSREQNMKDISSAVETLVRQHSMLRSRFVRSDGKWQQLITKDITGSYQFRIHEVATLEAVAEITTASQTGLDVENGPLFSVDMINVQSYGQLIYLIAHHLVVDLVSWRIILRDFEEVLETGKLMQESPFSFQAWCNLQAEYAQQHLSPKKVLPFKITKADHAYWGMQDKPNMQGDTLLHSFVTDVETTTTLLEKCQDALGTEPADIFLATLLHSFGQVFPDRDLPTVFSEGHGREPWDADIDLSNTVGWFTTMAPIYLEGKDEIKDVVDMVRRVKDTKRRLLHNGWPYFTSRFLNKDGILALKEKMPVEVVFNYLGRYQQLEREEGLLKREAIPDLASDVASDVPRLGLFDVSIVVADGRAQFSIFYNRLAKYQESVVQWAKAWEQSLVAATKQLSVMQQTLTLSDFPLMSWTYEELEHLQSERFQDIGVLDIDEIEDIYPCSPMQQGLMLSQTRSTGNYQVQVTYEVTSTRTVATVDTDRLTSAWQQVVDRHPMLRTTFVKGLSGDGFTDQVVRKKLLTTILLITCDNDDALGAIADVEPMNHNEGRTPHRLVVCTTASKKTYIQLEVNHAIIDASTISLLLSDLMRGYENVLPTFPAPRYSEYIKYIQAKPIQASLSYWSDYLDGLTPCHFPTNKPPLSEVGELKSAELVMDTLGDSLRKYSQTHNVTVANVVQAVWGLVLQAYTGAEDVCFGYLSSGRDVPVDRIEELVGPLINMLVCRVNAPAATTGVVQMIQQVQENYSAGLDHQHCSLAQIQHGLKLGGRPLFNTIMSIQRASSGPAVSAVSDAKQQQLLPEISFKSVGAHDPTEYDLTLNVVASDTEVNLSVSYWSSKISDWMAHNLTSTFASALQSVLSEEAEMVQDLNLFSERNRSEVFAWNSNQYQRIESCVHHEFAKQVALRPDAPAVTAWDAPELTYSELDRISTRLAIHLQHLGVKTEVKVALCFEKSAWAVVSMLAVLKAGGACVSVDPTHPRDRLGTILRDIQCTIVLRATKFDELFSGIVSHSTTVVGVDQGFITELPTVDHISLDSPVTASSSAFVVYTSGSTGIPKGVVLEHANVCTSANAHGKALSIGPQSRVLQFAAYVFDISIQDIFTTLMHGGCVCVLSDTERLEDLSGAINRLHVNWACITPTVAGLLRPDDVPELKTLTLAGEAVPQKVINIWGGNVSLNNCYGPAESTIYCAWNGAVGSSKDKSPSNIGTGLSSLLWVADVTSHDRLAPVGSVGELLIEGPLLAREYLNDGAKTSASFITGPKWGPTGADGRPRRVYKTGDLVQYNSDGTLDYLGRKDTQVKINGQRLELGEIEYHLIAQEMVESAMVVLPKRGPGRQMLIAITVLKKELSDVVIQEVAQLKNNVTASIEIVSSEQTEAAKYVLRSHLETRVPKYMVPTIWLAVDTIPLNTSGKLDRARVAHWIEELAEQTFQQNISTETEQSGPTTTMDHRLQDIMSRVLNLSPANIVLNRSFQSLGGDSITAMQVITRARGEGIILRVQDVLGAGSISDMALLAKIITSESSVSREDEVERLFDLTPIQQMYFQMNGGQKPTRFNQSFFLRLTTTIAVRDLRAAIETLVRQHSMLRARFVQDGGMWRQLISKDVTQSFRFRVHGQKTKDDLTSELEVSQASLDVVDGPVFVADLFNVEDGQLLFLAAHHLVIDLVSWRVMLHDLEELLETGTISSDPPFPFQAWERLQSSYAKEHLNNVANVLPYQISPTDLTYWGMVDKQNVYDDVERQIFVTDVDTTASLLVDCQDALKTEPVELLMATLLQSFTQVFSDRPVPTLFSEGHGRETISDIDISDTVGWFTTMSPLYVPIDQSMGLVDVLKRVKDTRRTLPDSGWPYFTSRFLTADGQAAFANHLPMEVLFNYLGRYQQLERQDSLLAPEAVGGKGAASDVGPNVPRFALFEISIVVIQGMAQFTMAYNKHMGQVSKITEWMRAWESALNSAVKILPSTPSQHTLHDLTLLSLTYGELEILKNERLPAIGLDSFANVEDIYPASPIQQGLLLSQERSAGNYEIDFIYEVKPSGGHAVDQDRLLSSWALVVDRHAVLRTVFTEGVSEDGISNQVVLKKIQPMTRSIRCRDDLEVISTFKSQPPLDHSKARPLHQFTVCISATGRVYVRFEINHAIMDAASSSLLVQDLTLAYDNILPLTGTRPLYSEYIKYIQERPLHISTGYWKSYLASATPCHFPAISASDSSVAPKSLQELKVDLNLSPGALGQFCARHSVTVANVMQAVWGFVLRAYTGSNDLCFGYLSSGRDLPIQMINEIAGPFINMMVCRMNIDDESQIVDVIQRVQNDYLAGLEHQHCSLAHMQHGLDLRGRSLFNTVMSVQRLSSNSGGEGQYQPPITFENIGAHDPTEVKHSFKY